MPVTPSVEPDLVPLHPVRVRMSRGRLLVGTSMVLLGFFLGTSPAAAHSELESTTPAADSSTTDPVTSVSLTFGDGVQPGFAQIAVLDPAGNDIADGEPTIDGNTVTQPVVEAAAGSRSVSYRIVSADGHTVQGTYAFTVATVDPQSSAPTGGTTASTAPAPATVAPSRAEASPAAVSTADEGSTGQTTAIVAVLAVGVVATVAITVARRRHRRG